MTGAIADFALAVALYGAVAIQIAIIGVVLISDRAIRRDPRQKPLWSGVVWGMILSIAILVTFAILTWLYYHVKIV